jgi:CRISPR-associated protein Csd1
MMLQALIAYAERENLGDADFASVGVRWEISLTGEGRFAGLIPLSENPDEKKLRAQLMLRPFSSTNELAQGQTSYFLCDSLERAALFLDAKAPEKAEGRGVQHQYFKALLRETAGTCAGEKQRLDAVCHFLDNEKALAALHLKLASEKAKPSDNVIFSVDGVNLLLSEELKEFWRIRRRRMASNDATEMRVCIATGKLAETLNTTEKIKGVPGGLAMGTNLISFDKDSFCSFGLEQAQNAALSAPAELKIRSALNQLIAQSRQQRLIFNNVIYLHWTKVPVEIDPMDLLSGAEENAIERLLKSVHEGKRVLSLEQNAYYAASLSGNGARIVVRDWLESTVPEVESHLAEWFQDLSIIDRDGSRVKRDFKFYSLLHGLVRAGLDELPPALPTQLFHGALAGRSVLLPQAALAAALRRQQLDQESKLNPARMALIKACLIRSPNRKETDTMTEQLDPESKDPAYLCGALFAVIGRLQLLALGKVGASIADRTYGGVATRPATTLGPIFTKLPPYVKKANARFPGSGTNRQKEIEDLCCRIEALGGLLQTLSLEEQGRFALGYYCRLAQYRTDRAEAEAAEKAAKLEDETSELNP